jgi:hypothetical protein
VKPDAAISGSGLIGMTIREKRERLALNLATAILRHEWAVAEQKRQGSTPALAKFIKESGKECRDLTAKLGELEPAKKRPKASPLVEKKPRW